DMLMLALLPGPIPHHRLRVHVGLGERDLLQLSLREHLGLIRIPRRVGTRTLPIREHGIPVRHITKLHREHPGIAPARHELAVRSAGEAQRAEAAELGRAAAYGHINVTSADTVYCTPCKVPVSVLTRRLRHRPCEGCSRARGVREPVRRCRWLGSTPNSREEKRLGNRLRPSGISDSRRVALPPDLEEQRTFAVRRGGIIPLLE